MYVCDYVCIPARTSQLRALINSRIYRLVHMHSSFGVCAVDCTSEGRFVFFGRAEGNPAAYWGDAPSPQAGPHCHEPVSKELRCVYSKRANIVAHTYFQHFTLPGTVIGYSKHASITYTMCCGAMVSLVKFCC